MIRSSFSLACILLEKKEEEIERQRIPCRAEISALLKSLLIRKKKGRFDSPTCLFQAE